MTSSIHKYCMGYYNYWAYCTQGCTNVLYILWEFGVWEMYGILEFMKHLFKVLYKA